MPQDLVYNTRFFGVCQSAHGRHVVWGLSVHGSFLAIHVRANVSPCVSTHWGFPGDKEKASFTCSHQSKCCLALSLDTVTRIRQIQAKDYPDESKDIPQILLKNKNGNASLNAVSFIFFITVLLISWRGLFKWLRGESHLLWPELGDLHFPSSADKVQGENWFLHCPLTSTHTTPCTQDKHNCPKN